METMNVHHPLLCCRDDLCLCDVDLSTDISTLRYLLEHVVHSRTGNLPHFNRRVSNTVRQFFYDEDDCLMQLTTQVSFPHKQLLNLFQMVTAIFKEFSKTDGVKKTRLEGCLECLASQAFHKSTSVWYFNWKTTQLANRI